MEIPSNIRKRYSLGENEYRREDVDRAIGDLLDMSRRLVAENDRLKAAAAAAEQKEAADREALAELEAKLSDAEKRALADASSRAQLESELAGTRERLAAAEEKLGESEKKLSDAEANLEETVGRLFASEEKLRDAMSDISGYRSRLEEAGRELAESEKKREAAVAQALAEAAGKAEGEAAGEGEIPLGILMSIEAAVADLKKSVDGIGSRLARIDPDGAGDESREPQIVLVSAETVKPGTLREAADEDAAEDAPEESAAEEAPEESSDKIGIDAAAAADDAGVPAGEPSADEGDAVLPVEGAPEETSVEDCGEAGEAGEAGGEAEEDLSEETAQIPDEAADDGDAEVPAGEVGQDVEEEIPENPAQDSGEAAGEIESSEDDGDQLLRSLEAVFGAGMNPLPADSAAAEEIAETAEDASGTGETVVSPDAEACPSGTSGEEAAPQEQESPDADDISEQLRKVLGFLAEEEPSDAEANAPEEADSPEPEETAGAAPLPSRESGDRTEEGFSIGSFEKFRERYTGAARKEEAADAAAEEAPDRPAEGSAENDVPAKDDDGSHRSFSEMKSSLDAIRRKFKR